MFSLGGGEKSYFSWEKYSAVSVGKRFSRGNWGLFWLSGDGDNRGGFQISLGGEREEDILENILDKEKTVPKGSSVYPLDCSYLWEPPEVEGLSFQETISQLDTPEKVAWYAGNYFEYESTPNKFCEPEEIFNLKKGACDDQMGFQAYALSRHGYEAYILQQVTVDFGHAICLYKDKETSKWNGISYYKLFETQANSPEELFEMTYPGAFSMMIRDTSDGKVLGQFDSSSRDYLLRWLKGKDQRLR
ncbi:MAG: hypothetical protein AB1797_09220 [bacterium]